MKNIIITENQLRLLVNNSFDLIKEEKRPFEKLKECIISEDYKYIVYDNNLYDSQTGDLIPISEGWSLSDILHTGADVLSVAADFIIPGTGAIIDTLNALSYVIEAQFKTGPEQDKLYLMAAITFAFVVLPGPLQALATPLKNAIKTGRGFASKAVVRGLKIIGGILESILVKLPATISKALKSPLAKRILGRFSGKISKFFQKFAIRIRKILRPLTKAGEKVVKKGGKEAGEKAIKEVGGSILQKQFTIKNCKNMRLCDTKSIFKSFSDKLPTNTVFNPSKVKVLQKSNVAGREVAEVQLENGSKVLFYKSSGANVGTTGKKAGEWFTIPGFAENGWFIKTTESVALTKGGNKYATSMAKHLEKNGLEGLGANATKNLSKASAKVGQKAAKEVVTNVALQAAKRFFQKIPKISKGGIVLRKAGFAPGFAYRYTSKKGAATTAKVMKVSDNGVLVMFKNGNQMMVPVETFVQRAVGAPWLRRGAGTLVPLFIKRFFDVITPDGSDIDYKKLDQLKDLDPAQTSKESLDYLMEEVADYEGDAGTYNVSTNVTDFQNALELLGYKLVRAGADGKFGPETKEQLTKFQNDNKLTSSIGKMDRVTARKLAELLKTKNIPNSLDLQNKLNKV
jgi:hypothetical protein